MKVDSDNLNDDEKDLEEYRDKAIRLITDQSVSHTRTVGEIRRFRVVEHDDV